MRGSEQLLKPMPPGYSEALLTLNMKHYPLSVRFQSNVTAFQWSVAYDVYAKNYTSALFRVARKLNAAKRANKPYGLPQIVSITSIL